MSYIEAIESLEREWDRTVDTSFFGKLYLGEFDSAGFERVKVIFRSIENIESGDFDRRFVELTWFIPTFMRWQQDSWREDGKDTTQLDRAIAFFEQRLTIILGLP